MKYFVLFLSSLLTCLPLATAQQVIPKSSFTCNKNGEETFLTEQSKKMGIDQVTFSTAQVPLTLLFMRIQ